jgi:hypothetical protein
MDAVRDTERVKKIFASGHVSMVDPDTKYRFSLMAYCPKDNGEAFVERYERSGPALSRVVFSCTNCFHNFEVPAENIWIV